MSTITTNCQWCEIAPSVTTVIVKGYEEFNHDVCIDCASIVNLVECRNCDNVANFMQDTIYLTPRLVGMCFECDEQQKTKVWAH